MSHRMDVVKLFTGTSSDALAGEALDPIPANGYVRVYATDVVSTATIEVEPALHPNPTGPVAQHVVESPSTMPELATFLPHWETEVSKGEKLTITLGGTVSALALWVSFMSAD